jgi:tetratricopeptide (TPR) repeat protein
MTKKAHLLNLLFGLFLIPTLLCAQVDFNKTPNDDLGNNENKFQEYFFEAIKQKGIENYEKAIEYIQKCISINPTEASLYFELGKNHNKLGNYVLAANALNKALELKPGNVWILDELYFVYIQQKDYNSAVNTIKELVKYQPKYKEDLANIYVQIKDYKSALAILDELDENFGITSEREQLRNNIYKITGQQDVLIDNLETQKTINPEDEANYLKLIYRYSENNQPEKAFETAEELLKLNPNSQLVHLALYKFYIQKNELDLAVKSMKIVINSAKIDATSKRKVLNDFVSFVAQNPQYEPDLIEATSSVTDPSNAVDLGNYYFKKGDKSKALEYYFKAYQNNNQDFTLIKQIILIQIDLSDYKNALDLSDKAIEIYPAQPILYLLNGVSLNALNRYQEAIDTLEIGVDYLIEDVRMEKDFYNQLSKAFNGLNNLEKANTFKEKANKLKIN